jgi:hypothetical protein
MHIKSILKPKLLTLFTRHYLFYQHYVLLYNIVYYMIVDTEQAERFPSAYNTELCSTAHGTVYGQTDGVILL